MNKLRTGALTCVVLLFGVSAALAGPLTNIVVFGDSLSDVGNVFAATSGTTPNPADPVHPYWNGRFSNGPVWAEYYAERLGLGPLQPALLGGSNYAFGGAETPPGTSYRGTPNMPNQGAMYLAAHTPADTDLFIVWGGANDFFHAFENNLDPGNPHIDPTAIPDAASTSLAQLVGSLYGAGAKSFLVLNLPPLGHTPWISTVGGAAEAALYDEQTVEFNAMLQSKLDALKSGKPDLSIEMTDVWSAFNAVIAQPEDYGLVNVTDEYVPGANADQYLFWDDVHPTTRAHWIIAAVAANQDPAVIVPEPAAGLLLAVGSLCLLAYAMRRRKQAV